MGSVKLARYCKRNHFRTSVDGHKKFRVRQAFDGLAKFRKVLRDYCIQKHKLCKELKMRSAG